MSTRCCIEVKQTFKIEENGPFEVKSVMLYYHHDGYPQGVGFDLYSRLKKYTQHWDIDTIVNALIKDPEDEYEYTAFNHTDIEYMYVIDCSARTLKCYECQWIFEDEQGNVVDKCEIGKEIKLDFEQPDFK